MALDILVSPKDRMLKAAILRDRAVCSTPARVSSTPVSLAPFILEEEGHSHVGLG